MKLDLCKCVFVACRCTFSVVDVYSYYLDSIGKATVMQGHFKKLEVAKQLRHEHRGSKEIKMLAL